MKDWTTEDWSKVIFCEEAPFRFCGTAGRSKGEERKRTLPCFSSVGSIVFLPKNAAMNEEWYQKVLQEQLLPTIQERFPCVFSMIERHVTKQTLPCGQSSRSEQIHRRLQAVRMARHSSGIGPEADIHPTTTDSGSYEEKRP